MSTVDPAELQKLSMAVLAALRRDGRLPVRLDEEDENDIIQEGLMAALAASVKYDPNRGSIRAYFTQLITRAQLRCAWKIANAGITGDISSIQVWSSDEETTENGDIVLELASPDVADEIEAFDHIWHTRYERD